MELLLSLFPALAAGLVAGATVALPFGPMGQLAARLTAERHRRQARQVAFTCLLTDSLMAGVVLLGLSFLPMPTHWGFHPWVLAVIGSALILLGAELWYAAPHSQPGRLPGGFAQPWHCAAAYTLLHPGALLAFSAAFATLHAKGVFAYGAIDKLACWLGVVLGVATMWVAWLALVHRLKQSIEPSRLRLFFARGLAVALGVGGAALLIESGIF